MALHSRTLPGLRFRLFGAIVLAIAAMIAGVACVANGTAAGDSTGAPGQVKFVIQEQHRANMLFATAVSLELLGGALLSPFLPTHDSEHSFIRLILGTVLGATLLVLVSIAVLMVLVAVTSHHRISTHGIH